MIKKIIIVLIILVIIGIAGFIGVNYYIAQSYNQVKLQYDKEVISSLKRQLDFTPFEEGLAELTDDDIKKLDTYILEKSIEDIQKSLMEGNITCEQLVLYYIHRISKYDRHYNSIIQLNKQALELAKIQDAKIKNQEELGQLFGTIVLIKDNISEMTMNTASGAYALRDLTTKRDSFIVNQLKEQDAIILGKANLSEWSYYLSTPMPSGFSALGGQTKNAYGRYDVGGSSSGSTVAASLNFSTVTLGSETAGSMIFPAGQNSVVGLKPTLGLLSRDLIIPISEAQDTAGIVGKSVEDVLKIFRVTLAYDKNDPLAKHINSFDHESLKAPLDGNYLQGKRLGLIKENTERNKVIRQELEALGAEIVEIELDQKNLNIDMTSVLNYGMIEDVKAFLNHPDVNAPYKSLDEILAYNQEDPKNRIPYGSKLHEDALKSNISKDNYEEIVANNRKMASQAIDNALKDNNIEAIVSFSNTLSAIYAPAMYPALTVPAGYKKDGEPLGVTFVGSLNDDMKLVNIGYSYEQGTHHRNLPTEK